MAKKKDEEVSEPVYQIKHGIVKLPDGSLKPTKMLDILEVPLDDYSDIELSESDVKRLRMHIMKMRTGIQAMAPLLCPGPVKCKFRQRCPLVDKSVKDAKGEIDYIHQDLKRFPIGRQCLIERDFLEYKRREYIEEYNVDINSTTEMSLVSQLAELDLYEYRVNLVLAHGDHEGQGQDLLKAQISGIDKQGNVLRRLEIHPAFELKEKIHRMRNNILEAMVGTRKEQYKQAAALRKKELADPSTVIASLREKLTQLQKDEDLIDVEYKEITDDETPVE